jgi:DNA-directed RNA polymerase subunit RPC12/RpoP
MSDTNTKTVRLSELANQDEHGLVCRKCGCRHFNVLHTRPMPNHIMRERKCRNCGKKIHTRESAP